MDDTATDLTRPCPFCGNDISIDARACRYCRSPLVVEPTPHAPIAGARTCSTAVWALVLSLLFGGGCFSVLALIVGRRARKQIAESEGALIGDGIVSLANGFSWLGIIVGVIYVLMVINR